MQGKYQIHYVEKPEESAWGIIGGGVSAFNLQQAGDQDFSRICFGINGPDEEIVGGVLGEVYWDWLHLDLLWVKEELRGHGYGDNLLKQNEDEARKRGARYVYLDTFSFQAPDFYKKHGYQMFGELQDFPPSHQRHYLKKQL